jgi:hypothetical protein
MLKNNLSPNSTSSGNYEICDGNFLDLDANSTFSTITQSVLLENQ